jgi:hypothetical protein
MGIFVELYKQFANTQYLVEKRGKERIFSPKNFLFFLQFYINFLYFYLFFDLFLLFEYP